MTCAARTSTSAAAPLISAGQPWPDADAWRPAGWQTGLSPSELAEALAAFAAADASRRVPWLARGVSEAAAKADGKLLRDCWSTPAWSWRLAVDLMGAPPAVDPFWNPWSTTHAAWAGVRLLDGREGRDGYDARLWGDGLALVNWPHSDNARGMRATAAHVLRGQPAAVVAPLDGCEWVQGAQAPAHRGEPDPASAEGGEPLPGAKAERAAGVVGDLAGADFWVLLGRCAFVPPPGIAASSPRGAYVLALFNVGANIVCPRRILVPEIGREVVLLRGAGDFGAPARVRRALSSAAAAPPPECLL